MAWTWWNLAGLFSRHDASKVGREMSFERREVGWSLNLLMLLDR